MAEKETDLREVCKITSYRIKGRGKGLACSLDHQSGCLRGTCWVYPPSARPIIKWFLRLKVDGEK